MLFRDSKICELCVGKFIPIFGIKYSCYKESYFGSIVVSAIIGFHKFIGTWKKKVTIYVALTEFARNKFIEGGLPPEKILVKPNFIFKDHAPGPHRDNFALFVGRLSQEKGLRILIEAFKVLSDHKLKIIGDGPLRNSLLKEISSISNIDYLGNLSNEQVINQMKNATFQIFPSGCYEGMPRTIIESFSVGLPVVASNLGAMSSMIVPNKNGLHFEPEDREDLMSKISWMFMNPEKCHEMGLNARKEFEERYSAEKNYQMIENLLKKSLEIKKDKS